MKLAYPKFNFQIDIDEQKPSVLVVENPKLFREVVEELVEQCNGGEGGFILSESNKEIKIADNIVCLVDYFSLDFNDKKILSKVHTILKGNAYIDHNYEDTGKIISNILSYIEAIADGLDYPLVYSETIDVMGIIKLAGVKLEETYESLLEKIVDYINLMVEFCKIRYFVFINIKAYLEDEELEKLYEHSRYKKVNILLVEQQEKNYIEGENKYIIDKELCEIY